MRNAVRLAWKVALTGAQKCGYMADRSRQDGAFKISDPIEGLRYALGDDAVAAYLSVHYHAPKADGGTSDIPHNAFNIGDRDRVDVRA